MGSTSLFSRMAAKPAPEQEFPVRPAPFFARPLLLALAIPLAACSIMAVNQARETEQLLAAAGFRVKLADTPDKLAHVEALTQLKLVPHSQEGKTYYVYADATRCHCVYWGDESAYQTYQQLALSKEIAEDQRMAAQMNEDAALNWGMWGPGPWWVY